MWSPWVPETGDNFDHHDRRSYMTEHIYQCAEKVPIVPSASASARIASTLAWYANPPDVGMREVSPARVVGHVPRAEDARVSALDPRRIANSGGILIPRLLWVKAHLRCSMNHGGEGPRAEFSEDVTFGASGGTKAGNLGVPRGVRGNHPQGSQSEPGTKHQPRSVRGRVHRASQDHRP